MNLRALEENKQRQEVVLTVYFSGTSHAIKDQACLGGFLYANNIRNEGQLSLGFSGSGVTNGISGVLFGSGLKKQCQLVKKQVLDLIKQGKKIKLNCYGHSRGGIAALLLAKMLGDFDEDVLELNLALMDTVPGNFLTTQKIDFLGWTLANQAMDLSKCHNLKRVLSLYTNEPLSKWHAHAPLLPKYPKKAQVEEDVTPGCHSGAQYQRLVLHNKVYFLNDQSLLTFSRIRKFLVACGTAFNFLNKKLIGRSHIAVDVENAGVLREIYDYEKDELRPHIRASHSYRSVKIKTDPNQPYVNRQHQEVVQEAKMEGGNNYALSIEPPLSPRISRSARSYNEAAMAGLFKEFLSELLKGMSKKSQASAKGEIMQGLQSEAAALASFTDKQALKNALRNVLALLLQRDRHAYSLFSTTTTGYAARTLLRQDKYLPLAELIQGSANHQLRYRDLRMFVLGENKESYFNARYREHTYQILRESALTNDNLCAYLARKN